VTKGLRRGEVFALDDGALILGRAPDNDIVLDHTQISQHHTRITKKLGGVFVEDLDSTNGTFVNGERLNEAQLISVGAVIGLGEAIAIKVTGGTSFQMEKDVTDGLLEGIKEVQSQLAHVSKINREGLIERLGKWQKIVETLVSRVAQKDDLATFYEIIRVMNSSLDLSDTLSLVMDSLIRLTDAERGCLMLLDQTGELIMEAARHFDQQDVDGSDLDLSHTVVRRALDSEEPVLTTNAQHDPRFSSRQSVVGYHLRSIVCVPLRVGERTIGAIYLDNRIREGAFSEEDLPILTAFASQAAIAIENARLYTMTDQALASRVEELTILQQIDRDLNACLDFDRVLDLTLSWALRATDASTGLLCILDEEGRVKQSIRSEGNGSRVDGLEPAEIDLVRRSAEPIVVGRLRMLVPLRLEGRTMGVLDLRSEGAPLLRAARAELAGRLADHAAVAIENARLYEQVQQANRAKSEFVSIVAHELRTPMTSIRGYASMLEKEMVGPLTPQQREFTRTIHRNVDRMKVLVSDLQDISRLETGQLQLEPSPTALKVALEDALQSTIGQIEEQAQRLEVDLSDDLPLVRADPSRLTQILINLLSNARKYTPKGGQIRVRAWREDAYVYCEVSDTGIGISPEDKDHLFTKFFRSDAPEVQETSGTGLGLCITKNLVELQGGAIDVVSEVGEGTTFTFTVPVALEEFASEDPVSERKIA
jgi:signal transduction histidine kinase